MSAAQLHVDSLLPPMKIGMPEVGQTSSWLSACCWMQKQEPHLLEFYLRVFAHVHTCSVYLYTHNMTAACTILLINTDVVCVPVLLMCWCLFVHPEPCFS